MQYHVYIYDKLEIVDLRPDQNESEKLRFAEVDAISSMCERWFGTKVGLYDTEST